MPDICFCSFQDILRRHIHQHHTPLLLRTQLMPLLTKPVVPHILQPLHLPLQNHILDQWHILVQVQHFLTKETFLIKVQHPIQQVSLHILLMLADKRHTRPNDDATLVGRRKGWFPYPIIWNHVYDYMETSPNGCIS